MNKNLFIKLSNLFNYVEPSIHMKYEDSISFKKNKRILKILKIKNNIQDIYIQSCCVSCGRYILYNVKCPYILEGTEAFLSYRRGREGYLFYTECFNKY